jgi:hypothetical protein
MRKLLPSCATLEVLKDRPAQEAVEVEIEDEPIMMPAQVAARVNTFGKEHGIEVGE